MGEDWKEKNRWMDKQSLQDSPVPAGEQAEKEARKKTCGDSNRSSSSNYSSSSLYSHVGSSYFPSKKGKGKSSTFSNICEATSEEDEDKSRREESSKIFLLHGKDPTRAHLQGLGKAQRRCDD